MQNQAWLNSYGVAMLKTVFRRYSAKLKKDAQAEKEHKQYQDRLCKEISVRTKDVKTSWKQFLTEVRKANVKVGIVTPNQMIRLQKQIWDKGFPELETTLLKEWQLGDCDIHWLRILMACVPVSRSSVNVIAMVDNLIKMNDKYEFCDCRCEE